MSSPPNNPVEPLVTVREIAEMLSVSQKTVYDWVRRALIPHYRLVAGIRFSPTDVLAWARRQTSVETQSMKEKVDGTKKAEQRRVLRRLPVQQSRNESTRKIPPFDWNEEETQGT